ncbi:MAG: TRAFs-binding domain-containing protein [Candidatus Methylacidiphilales bacterium]|nr:TRAFs-binding domain-containing protein [Candidatus Methylacidiphilales bacterium]
MNLPPELLALIQDLARNVVRESDAASSSLPPSSTVNDIIAREPVAPLLPGPNTGTSAATRADADAAQADRAQLLENALIRLLGKGYRIVSPNDSSTPSAPGNADNAGVVASSALVPTPPPAPVAIPDPLSPAEHDLIDRLKRKKLTLGEIRDMWDQRQTSGWRDMAATYVLLGERLLGAGEPFFAHDVVAEGRKFAAESATDQQRKRLRQLQALALARSGAPRAGRTLLAELLKEGHEDVETLSMLARTYKDMARSSKNAEERQSALDEAQRYYQRAFDSSNEYYPAINAATCAVLLGRREEAGKLAARVLELCDAELQRNGNSYWLAATRAEATLICGSFAQAAQLYREAVNLARMDWGSLGSSRKQAEILLEHLGHDVRLLNDCFPPCRIAAFSGAQMCVDLKVPFYKPGAQEEKDFHDRLCDYFKRTQVRVGFSAGTDWRDIVFLETILENEGEVHIVYPGPEPRHGLPPAQVWSHTIPCDTEFKQWEMRWERLLHKATRISYAHQLAEPAVHGTRSYPYLILLGLARLKCAVLSAEFIQPTPDDLGLLPGTAHPLPVVTEASVANALACTPPAPANTSFRDPAIEGEPASAPSPSLQAQSPSLHEVSDPPVPIKRIDTKAIHHPHGSIASSDDAHSLKALLFADIVGYSKLSDHDVALFMKHYVGGVARMLEESGRDPEVKNTWGDAFYFAFSSVKEAGILALDLADFMKQIDAVELGLSVKLRIRIGLHAGPVYRLVDPITGRLNYVGSHVSRAARIEPIAAEGQVYASESFAALAFADGDATDFTCEYVGEIVLPKNFGKQRIYLLSRVE